MVVAAAVVVAAAAAAEGDAEEGVAVAVVAAAVARDTVGTVVKEEDCDGDDGDCRNDYYSHRH